MAVVNIITRDFGKKIKWFLFISIIKISSTLEVTFLLQVLLELRKVVCATHFFFHSNLLMCFFNIFVDEQFSEDILVSYPKHRHVQRHMYLWILHFEPGSHNSLVQPKRVHLP